MSMQELAHDLEIGNVIDPAHDDRNVTGNALRPQRSGPPSLRASTSDEGRSAGLAKIAPASKKARSVVSNWVPRVASPSTTERWVAHTGGSSGDRRRRVASTAPTSATNSDQPVAASAASCSL
jgi:hypothetical protein